MLPANFAGKWHVDTEHTFSGTPCWTWVATTFPTGYGQVSVGGGLRRRAHRVAYEALVGPIPEGLQIDHLCRNRACINPDHLEPVTGSENLRRAAAVNRPDGGPCRGCGRPLRTYIRPDTGTRQRRCSRCESQRGRQRRRLAAA